MGTIPKSPEGRSAYFRQLGKASAARRAEIREAQRTDALIAALVAAAPPLSPEQRAKLSTLLTPVGGEPR